MRVCTNCGVNNTGGQWWNLSGYYGITGYFCPACYDKVSHDSYKIPKNPNEYKKILDKQEKKRTIASINNKQGKQNYEQIF